MLSDTYYQKEKPACPSLMTLKGWLTESIISSVKLCWSEVKK